MKKILSALTFGNTSGFGGDGTLTFGLGSGVFEQTASDTLTFSNSGSYINFLSGSAGQLSLDGASSSFFANLVSSGDILVNGATATSSEFVYSTSGTQGIYELATAAPEPGTWAMLALGLVGLVAFQSRRNRFNSNI
jgi:hypothetical protein